MTTTRIALVRHGDVHNPQAVYYGRLPRFRLSDLGRRQATAAGLYLDALGVRAVYSSPLLRARQTAQRIAAICGVPLHVRRALIEVHTPFDGLPRAALAARDWDLYAGTAPPYEQPPDVAARAAALLAHLRRRHAGNTVAAVTHGDVVVFTLLHAVGLPVATTPRSAINAVGIADDYPANASVTLLTYGDGDTVPSVSYWAP